MTDLRRHAAESEQGLTTEPQRLLNRMLGEYDPSLSLRRIEPRDPAFTLEKQFGVWEDTAKTQSKWVFTLHEMTITNPGAVLARIVAGDNTKLTVKEKMALLTQANEAAELAKRREREEAAAAKREEMMFIATTGKSRIRHTINGEDLILSDDIRSARTHV